MSEVRLYGILLVALLVGAYMSWTKEDAAEAGTAVTLYDATPDGLEKLQFFSKNSTVTMTFRDLGADKVAWFEVESGRRSRVFVGGPDVEKLLKDFGPFEALRSLGKGLGEEELKLTGLDDPKRKLIVTHRSKAKTFDVGKRTSGSRDHYVRAVRGDEVYLVASRILSDLQFPEGKYMQRKLRTKPKTEVEKVTVSVGSVTKTALQRNRLSTPEAFWASEDKPDEKAEALGNYLDKLEKLSAVEYLSDEKPYEEATTVLDAIWYGENDVELGRVNVRRVGEGKTAKYYARSSDTKIAVKVSRYTVEQLERDAATALAN